MPEVYIFIHYIPKHFIVSQSDVIHTDSIDSDSPVSTSIKSEYEPSNTQSKGLQISFPRYKGLYELIMLI